MANRPIYISTDDINNPYIEESISFEWVKGMARCQQEKRREAFKREIAKLYDIRKWLEISTISDKELGKNLSALNLTINTNTSQRTVEYIYQNSKVYDNNKIIKFRFGNSEFPNEPYGMYYDYIYMLGLISNEQYLEELSKYQIFSDLKFNPNRQLNTQARAAAIFKTLYDNNMTDIIKHQNDFKDYYIENVKLRKIK